MPQRFLKPGITSSEHWNACSWESQSFYIRLLTLVDDFGRFEANPKLLRSLAFPLLDLTSDAVKKMMEDLHANNLAIFYFHDGKPYVQLLNWTERPRAGVSKFPTFDNTCEQMFADAGGCKQMLPPETTNPPESCEILPPSSSSSSSSSSSPYPLRVWEPDEKQKRLNALFHRRDTTVWSGKELKAYRALGEIPDDEMALLETYYRFNHPEGADIRRRDLLTLLNNFRGEIDRARNFRPKTESCF